MQQCVFRHAMAKPYAILVVAVLAVGEWAVPGSASPASVNIYNFIPGGTVRVECGAKVGGKTLQYGEHLGWGFTPSVWGTTRFTCAFQWGAKTQMFEVWADEGILDPPIPLQPCVQCVWRVGVDGFYLAEYSKPPSHQFYWIG